MKPNNILILIFCYFGALVLISWLTARKDNNDTFFTGNKKSPWYVVAFGMIGASLSGVTFISVPGWVEAKQFSYLQMILGNVIGYIVVALVLLPLYYRLNLTSIYTYLRDRFGNSSYKTGASFFLLSRVIGASFRLFLVANVLQLILFDSYGIPFWVTVSITILLIWVYTFKGGIKTIVWTDSLQTAFMLIAVGICIYSVSDALNINSLYDYINTNELSQVFFFEDYKANHYFWKHLFAGMFIAIVMVGLDQDMMQKNLTCKNIKDAQKNMLSFTFVIIFVNLLFLSLGVLLTDYANTNQIIADKDKLFPIIAMQGDLGIGVSIFFLLGLIAAAYSSADSALTSLTTSFSIDIIEIDQKPQHEQVAIRKKAHVLFSFILLVTILIFKYIIANESVISKIFQFAGYTYGPLLGFYAFGLFTKINIKDHLVPYIAIIAPIVTYLIDLLLRKLFGFEFGFFILIINGLLTFIGLYFIKKK